MKSETLLQRYLQGEATAEEIAELDKRLEADPQLRRQLVMEAQTDAGLREIALERIAVNENSERSHTEPAIGDIQRKRLIALAPLSWLVATAASVMIATLAWSQFTQPPVIATLLSVEDASWESSLPTEPGSKLTPGYLKLTSGIATIRFRSGAELTLEAPAKLILKTKMRTRLMSGIAMVNVPDSAIGFILETPDGYAVDYGTQFAVQVDGDRSRSDFEVLSGEISVHLDESDKQVRLTDRATASIQDAILSSADGPPPEQELVTESQVVRVNTDGRATSMIRNNKRKWLHPDMLLLRQSRTGNGFDRRAVFSFDVSDIDMDSVVSAKLRLNLVPSGIGFASRLPKINRFAIYGVTSEAKHDWKMDSTWEEAPSPEDGELLGKFEIKRSRHTGVYGIEGEGLLEFIKEHADRPISLILLRETSHIDGEGRSLVHAFASPSHPEAAGPVLEFTLSDERIAADPISAVKVDN
ncbi:MAG: FecR domain-containing protein [Rubripirellula sp.]